MTSTPEMPWYDAEYNNRPCAKCHGKVSPSRYVPSDYSVEPFEYDYLVLACRDCAYSFRTRCADWGPYVSTLPQSEFDKVIDDLRDKIAYPVNEERASDEEIRAHKNEAEGLLTKLRTIAYLTNTPATR